MPTKTKTREPAFVKLTLEWCNRQRKKKGKKPLKRLPKGIRYSASSCPCGTATNLVVGLYAFCDSNPTVTKVLPKSVKQFVKAFDDNELPQYIRKRGSKVNGK